MVAGHHGTSGQHVHRLVLVVVDIDIEIVRIPNHLMVDCHVSAQR